VGPRYINADARMLHASSGLGRGQWTMRIFTVEDSNLAEETETDRKV